ncbi:MAG: response regulator, partial [Bacillota bacterium]
MIRIQIADDEILARFALRTFLEKHFSNIEIIEESKNGKEAVKAALRLNPDLIVMDVRMPVMDGLEASQEILSKNPDAVIIIVSAYDNFPFLQTAVEIGIRGYFLKPLNEDVVLPKFTSIINYLESTHSDGSKKSNENIDSVKQILVNELIKLLIQGSDLETIG